ncbi:GNAT family N-acetyltransferase [Roseobacter sp. HKCCA0434]|uniref:GNAT family N-acetyltransferase n=1 Tax=Roseobacter sp. HKCCA0434 TaxID=3079297 RepID=UPI002905AA99|nr:GNAT family N-acetyltransferase [Roseobacter sp. HKCCA0434]
MTGPLGTLAAGGLASLMLIAALAYAFARVLDRPHRRALALAGLVSVAAAGLLLFDAGFRQALAANLQAVAVLALIVLPFAGYALFLRRIRRARAPGAAQTPAGLRLIEADDALHTEMRAALMAEDHATPGFRREAFSVAWKDEAGSVLGAVRCIILHDVAELKSLYVHPEARSRGIGRDLIEGALTECRARGARRAILDTFTWREVQPLYEELGFEVVRSVPYDREARLFMEKPL